MSRRLRAAYARAGLKPLSGGLWHPFRRKFATERKHFLLRDVAVAGGWKEARTLLECYQLADNATLRGVVLDVPKLFPDGLRAVTPSVTQNPRTRTTHGRRKSRLEKAVPVFGT
jgi:hypothetical protein